MKLKLTGRNIANQSGRPEPAPDKKLPKPCTEGIRRSKSGLDADSLREGLRIWSSSWRTYRYIYAKKGRKWNSADRITTGVLSYYGIYGIRRSNPEVSADGRVSCIERENANERIPTKGEISYRRYMLAAKTTELGDTETCCIVLHTSLTEHSLPCKENGWDESDSLMPVQIGGRHSESAAMTITNYLEDMYSNPDHRHYRFINHADLHDHNEIRHGWQECTYNIHSDGWHVHANSEHDPLAHIAHMGAGHSHNPFWWIHMYHIARETGRDHEVARGPHEGHNTHVQHHQHVHVHAEGNTDTTPLSSEREFHDAEANHGQLSHIAHLLAGRCHNPFERVHLYMLPHLANHLQPQTNGNMQWAVNNEKVAMRSGQEAEGNGHLWMQTERVYAQPVAYMHLKVPVGLVFGLGGMRPAVNLSLQHSRRKNKHGKSASNTKSKATKRFK